MFTETRAPVDEEDIPGGFAAGEARPSIDPFYVEPLLPPEPEPAPCVRRRGELSDSRMSKYFNAAKRPRPRPSVPDDEDDDPFGIAPPPPPPQDQMSVRRRTRPAPVQPVNQPPRVRKTSEEIDAEQLEKDKAELAVMDEQIFQADFNYREMCRVQFMSSYEIVELTAKLSNTFLLDEEKEEIRQDIEALKRKIRDAHRQQGEFHRQKGELKAARNQLEETQENRRYEKSYKRQTLGIMASAQVESIEEQNYLRSLRPLGEDFFPTYYPPPEQPIHYPGLEDRAPPYIPSTWKVHTPTPYSQEDLADIHEYNMSNRGNVHNIPAAQLVKPYLSLAERDSYNKKLEQTPIRFDFSNPQETCRRYDAAEREAARRNVCSSQMDNAMKAKNAVEMKIAAVQRKIQATDNKLHSPGVPASIRQELKEQIRMLDLDIQRHREEEAKIDDVISRLPGPRPQDAAHLKYDTRRPTDAQPPPGFALQAPPKRKRPANMAGPSSQPTQSGVCPLPYAGRPGGP
ncbi:uncharacterized protein LOC129715905 [Leucoraja erinacea]|uniref:uncharacterized protein LOC129715905 n=1 Tax=Leucoraja erinaceus TaxID=7782 RepID=UPI002455AAFC|nr:uncharacterized protein LOC129715905 [Leucoraja erinacea]